MIKEIPFVAFLLRYLKSKLLLDKKFVYDDFSLFSNYFVNKKGLEIGGPSKIFSTKLPIYQISLSLDGCNFSTNTIWEGCIDPDYGYNYFENRVGHQYIAEASDLKQIKDEKYDFLISSHCLEHCAKTLNEWLRIIKKGGVILLILPEKTYTFDHLRPITSFEHILEDFENKVDEDDLYHLEEILNFHDLSRGAAAGTLEQFKYRSSLNYENRCLHHHVFDFDLMEKIFQYLNVEIVHFGFEKPHHNIIVGLKK